MTQLTTPSATAFTRRKTARVAAAFASTGGLLATLGVVAAAPAFAAEATDCTDANTLTAPAKNAADIQGLIDADVVSVICLDGTFSVTETITVDRDITFFGLSNAVLDGGGTKRILDAEDGAAITVQNLTLQRGFDGFAGGAIYGDDITVIDSVLLDNSADFGGAIHSTFSSSATVTVRGSTFDGNTAEYEGGAIQGYGVITVENSTFVDNDGTDYAGAISAESLNVVDSTFVDNTTDYAGGAIWGNDVTVENSTFVGNEASGVEVGTGNGGAIRAESLQAVNSTFVANTAANEGGAIFAGSSDVQFSTFLNNAVVTISQASDALLELPGEAIYLSVSDGEVLSIRGNIFASESPQAQLGIGAAIENPEPGSIRDRGGNVFSTTALAEANFADPDDTTQFGKTPDEIFGADAALAHNGGSTQTLALVAGSPAIDAVPELELVSAPAFAPAAQAVTTDQRGVTRTVPFDAGSFEYVAPPTPTPTPTPTPEALPPTGADTGVAGWLAGAGVLLLGLGAAVAVAARRSARR